MDEKDKRQKKNHTKHNLQIKRQCSTDHTKSIHEPNKKNVFSNIVQISDFPKDFPARSAAQVVAAPLVSDSILIFKVIANLFGWWICELSTKLCYLCRR